MQHARNALSSLHRSLGGCIESVCQDLGALDQLDRQQQQQHRQQQLQQVQQVQQSGHLRSSVQSGGGGTLGQ